MDFGGGFVFRRKIGYWMFWIYWMFWRGFLGIIIQNIQKA